MILENNSRTTNIFWRIFDRGDTAYSQVIYEKTILRGATDQYTHSNGRFTLEIRTDTGTGPLLISPRKLISNTDHFIFQDTGPLNFCFSRGISDSERAVLLERHIEAFSKMGNNNCLTGKELYALKQAYLSGIYHSAYIPSDPADNALALASVGGDTIDIAPLLYSMPSTEISQTLIHEMMHLAGYTHPGRRRPPPGKSCAQPDPTLFDCLGDFGPYYASPPLRAELSINGTQSKISQTFTDCTKDSSGRCIMKG